MATGGSARHDHSIPGSNLTLIVQTRLEPHALSAAIRQTARSMNPEVPVRFSTMDEIVRESLAYPRFRAVLTGCFAVLAACLAIVGIYGVLSYVVGQRTSEIGLRFALGARPADVFRFVIGGSMCLVMWGLAVGLIGTLALSRVLQTLLVRRWSAGSAHNRMRARHASLGSIVWQQHSSAPSSTVGPSRCPAA